MCLVSWKSGARGPPQFLKKCSENAGANENLSCALTLLFSLLFSISMLFLFSDFPCSFCAFSFLVQGFEGFREEKNPCILGGKTLAFSKKARVGGSGWVPINPGNRSGTCSENCGFRIAHVVGCHSENGTSHSENGISNSESCSENTPELSASSENGLFTPRVFS